MSRRKSRNKTVHISFIHLYNEILKYEDILDVDLDIIYSGYMHAIKTLSGVIDFTKPSLERHKRLIIDTTLNIIKVTPKLN